MSLLDRIQEMNNHDVGRLTPFRADGRRVGWVVPDVADWLAGFADVFERDATGVSLATPIAGFEKRTAAIGQVARAMAEGGLVRGWRDELRSAVAWPDPEPVFAIERAATRPLGILCFGVQLVGYVGSGDDLRLWVSRRSATKSTGAGRRDVFVGGAMPHGLAAGETLLKEAWEEAGVPETLARAAQPIGEARFAWQGERGIVPGIDYQYELALPEDFVPTNQDGEVESFALVPASEVMAEIAESRSFFFDSPLAYTAFFLRHGLVPESEREDLVETLQGPVWLRGPALPPRRSDKGAREKPSDGGP